MGGEAGPGAVVLTRTKAAPGINIPRGRRCLFSCGLTVDPIAAWLFHWTHPSPLRREPIPPLGITWIGGPVWRCGGSRFPAVRPSYQNGKYHSCGPEHVLHQQFRFHLCGTINAPMVFAPGTRLGFLQELYSNFPLPRRKYSGQPGDRRENSTYAFRIPCIKILKKRSELKPAPGIPSSSASRAAARPS